MSLKTILATKGDEVVSINFTADLAAGAKLLTKHRIGALEFECPVLTPIGKPTFRSPMIPRSGWVTRR